MNKLKTLIFSLLIPVLTIYTSSAQQDSLTLQKIIAQTQAFANSYPPEKAYLHFDKPYYSVADTIWFKAYITQGQNQPSQLSKIVYIDIINSSDSLVQSLKLPVVNGAAYGNIPLTMEKFKQGNYHIRAYTLWMLNFSSAYFFNKNVMIGEAIDKQLTTNINFSTSKDEKINARIHFKDLSGKPYANKDINWQIVTNYDVTNRGRVTTDLNGVANILLPDDTKRTSLESNSKLVTSFIISDLDPPISATFNLRDAKLTNDLQFFPEGGEFITGIPLQIAFKGLKSNGLGVSLKGVIKDDLGNKLTDFSSKHLGMGSFYINAEPGRRYTAEVTFTDGNTATFNLPATKSTGISLQAISKFPTSITVKVIANTAFFTENKGKNFYIVAQQNGVVYFSAKAVLQNQLFTVPIPTEQLPTGILQLTLFSLDATPLSERLVFVKNKDVLNLAIKADKPSYGIKQKVKLAIHAKDTSAAVLTNLSLAVTDETKVPVDPDNETTILSTLLLTSEIQGYIEKPNYYFNNMDEKKYAALDVLLLTQGFRRFAYKDILAGKFPPIGFLPEQGINISGTLRNKTGLPINKGTMLLTIPDKRYNKQLTTNSVGEFIFKDLVFSDSSKVSVSAKYNPNPSNLMIMINGFPEAAAGKNIHAPDEVENIDSAISKYLSNSSKQYISMRTIKTVNIVGSKVNRPSHNDYPGLSTLSPQPDHLIEATDIGACNLLTDCLRFRLTGVTYFEKNFYITRDFNAGRRIPMLIFLNGLSIDFDGINSVMPQDLENIEIFLKDDIGTLSRTYGTNGVIVINAKKVPKSSKKTFTQDDLKKLIPDSFIVTYSPGGYSVERTFYSPKYSTDPAALNFTDLRTTIYWNPKVVTDANGNAQVEFFNADGKGTYKAVVEGTDARGNIGRTVFRYTVK